ncbi:hydrolase [Caballeronia arationis]|jgi:putative hydrolase of the HAD superfamily|uniref:Haloacid dehalogenase superfamily, subfamily IA, variant 3 with third motif having DD or ED n=1 Tax=Caballeronia arationis TaxID=1777142 RepID=A0A7Z7IDH8_9BURK|nr:HAD family phosphatase [Caballeronia arationis]SAK63857.1 hydrolase [Caballeronia arationis]SOE88719.1 haloacid dehalogenase superfamily, subfamily IA, variant 3 with third motif having DD or ED [Caballeronia arationis]
MPATISAVLFDMDGVLCEYDRAVRVAHLSAATNRSAEAIRHAIWGSGLEAQADAGALDDARYMSAVDDLLGCAIALEDWLLARRAAMSPNPDVLALASAVSDRSRIAVLTNNCHMVVDNLPFICPDIARVFGSDDVYATASFKALKPAREAYLRCVDAMGVSAAEVLFIDDVDANVTGAIDAGLAACKFTTANALAIELRRLNLL